MKIFGISKLPVSKLFPSIESETKKFVQSSDIAVKNLHPEQNQSIPVKNRFSFKNLKQICHKILYR